MTQTKNIELLAPAGSVAGLRAVIAAGADAVYIGGSRFGARAYAENPDEDDLLDAIDYAHLRGVKVYMTVNTLLKNSEMDDLYDYILPYYMRGIDGVLVQDFGVLRYLHCRFPDLPLHASTQMTVTGPESALLLKKYGVTRVVPAREMSLEELFRIGRESGLEVEAFVHGALCVCMSGMCLASSMIGGRSGNRGRCAQPCRLIYESEGTRAELLSPKDLCTLEFLPDLIEHGVVSLKIEGRMKQPEYAAGVVSIYRKYLDLYLSSGRKSYKVSREDKDTLLTLFNRDGFTDGYLKQHNGKDMMAFKRRTLNPKEEQARSDLYDRMNALYVAKEKSVPLTASVYVTSGQPLTMILESGGTEKTPSVCVTKQGDTAQAAEKRPLTKDRIAGQIAKTGGSDFTFANLDVVTDEQSFVPMGALNQLRRSALGELRKEMLEPYRRSEPRKEKTAPDNGKAPNRAGSAGDGRNVRTYAVSVETKEQFDAAAASGLADKIYISESIIVGLAEESSGNVRYTSAPRDRKSGNARYMEIAKHLISACTDRGKSPYIMLPFIERQGYMPECYHHMDELMAAGSAGFVARSFESAAHLVSLGLADMTVLDAGVYTWNEEALAWAAENGFMTVTAPYELNKKELRKRSNGYSEIIVYGRIPLMVTAQCQRKNISGCSGLSELLYLKDRTKRDFPVKCECVFCYNTVYNSEVLLLAGESDFLSQAGFLRRRIVFTTESRREAESILTAFGDKHPGENSRLSKIPHTKGHFNRGVE